MPVVVRESGQMWDAAGKLKETKALIPDRCYATTYKTIIEDCQKNGRGSACAAVEWPASGRHFLLLRCDAIHRCDAIRE